MPTANNSHNAHISVNMNVLKIIQHRVNLCMFGSQCNVVRWKVEDKMAVAGTQTAGNDGLLMSVCLTLRNLFADIHILKAEKMYKFMLTSCERVQHYYFILFGDVAFTVHYLSRSIHQKRISIKAYRNCWELNVH